MKSRMLAGELYLADESPLPEERAAAAKLTAEYNTRASVDPVPAREILTKLLGSIGEGAEIRAPFYCDYGYNIHVGARTFINFGLVALDVAAIRLGGDVQVGPNVQLLTATHPLDPDVRRQKWERGAPIQVGDNAWLGGGVIVCPGVTIGENTVVGAGAVVLDDLPAGVLAAGTPARVIREL
jgi:maltose O-acetyltransferase